MSGCFPALVKKDREKCCNRKAGCYFARPFVERMRRKKKQTMSVKLTTSNLKNPPAGPLGSFGIAWFDRAGLLA
jgi:hypothetical protein